MKFSLVLIIAMMTSLEDKPRLIYIGDPMCSWCYGFSDELDNIKEHYQESIDFQLIMGGLRPYNTETMVELKNFLSHHWNDVGLASGKKFNYAILEYDDIKYDTEPPSRACLVVRELKPSIELEFFNALQKAFYFKNKDLNKIESYFDILIDFDIDRKAFEDLFLSEAMKLKVKDDFLNAQTLGVRSFPTLILKSNDQYYAVAKGFENAETIIERIDLLMKTKQ